MSKNLNKVSITISAKPTFWFKICIFKLRIMEVFNPFGAFYFSEQIENDIYEHPKHYIRVKNWRRNDDRIRKSDSKCCCQTWYE